MREHKAEIPVRAWQGKAGIEFELHPPAGKGGGQKVSFKNPKKSDWWRMIFKLDDGGLGLRFVEPPELAFWVSRQGCPTFPCQDSQFPEQQVKHGGRELRVKNLNSLAGDYHFALRFRRPDGGIEVYDPVINNQNGGVQMHRLSAGAVVGAIAVGAAAIAGVAHVLDKRARDRSR